MVVAGLTDRHWRAKRDPPLSAIGEAVHEILEEAAHANTYVSLPRSLTTLLSSSLPIDCHLA